MDENRQLLVNQLDKKLQPFVLAKATIKPDRGWVHAIRKTLNMTLEQFSKRLGITVDGARKLELREEEATITLKSLKDAAEALNLQLVYGLVPKGESFKQMVQIHSNTLALEIVYGTHNNMELEDQAIENTELNKRAKDLAEKFIREGSKEIWD